MPVTTYPVVLDSRSPAANRASRNQSAGAAIALTTPFGAAATGIFTSTAHGLGQGAEVQFDSIAGPTAFGPIVGQSYYISATNLAANTFSLALTPDAAAPILKWTTDATAGSLRKVSGSNIVATNQVDVTA